MGVAKALVKKPSEANASLSPGQNVSTETEHIFKGENEILLDGIGQDLRRGLPLGLDKLLKNHMQGKVDVNACDEFGCYLLMSAAHGGMLDAVRDLLARGARINQEDDNGNTALHLSVLFDHKDVSAFLLEKGAEPEHRNHHGDRPGELCRERFYGKAFHSVKTGDITTVIRLVGRDFIPIDILEEQCDMSHIEFAPKVFRERCSKDGRFYFELEEDRPRDASSLNDSGERAPDGAVEQAPEEAVGPRETPTEDEEVHSMPLEAGPQAAEDGLGTNRKEDGEQGTGTTGRTLLMYAAEGGHAKLVRVLVRSRANILLEDSEGATAISMAKRNKHFDICRFLNERIPESHQTEIMTEETVELNELKKSFDAFCLLGSAELGASPSKGGRASTMDFSEFLKYLTHVGLAGPGKPCSKNMATDIFQWQMDVSTASGELMWPNFKQCLHRLAHQLHMKEIQGVPTDDLQDHSPGLNGRSELMKLSLTKVSRKSLQRELEAMQRSLDSIGDRCREVTSCKYAAYGFGVTTGRHKLRNETFDVYRKLFRAPNIQMHLPKFTKEKEVMKKEMLAKQFFNLIDKDRSGSLTRYELQWALEDFGFTKEEQVEVFQLVDEDNSGSVTLAEFIAGMSEGAVSFAGRQSKSGKKQTVLEIGLKISKVVNQKEQPAKILSISPGLFGMIFQIFCDHAMKERLYDGKVASCLFSAPKLSALMPEKKVVKKIILGINTRFAVSNPFDPRVLANGPVKMSGVESVESPRESVSSFSTKSPRSQASHSLESSPRNTKLHRKHTMNTDKENEGRPKTMSSKHTTNTDREDEGRPKTMSSKRNLAFTIQTFEETEKEHSTSVHEEVSWPLSTMSTDSVRLATPMQAGSRRAASAIGMVPSLRQRRFSQSKMKNLESPDGELLSEHTRVTLIPHRLTLTKSGQALVGGAETTDPKSVTSIAAQAVKKHRITRSGLNILNRLVFYSISFGAGHCAAVTDTGLIYTWGQGRYGQLGHGDEEDKIVPQPVRGITGKVKAVSASFYHNLAVTVNGHVFSWGDGKEGKLGHNDNAGRLLPTIVSYFVDRGLHVIAAQAGGSHSCALTSFYQIYTFGSGGNGRLGHGNDGDQWVPTMVSALELYAVVSLAAGYAHTAALTDDGQIFTWGSGKLGRLGHGSDSDEVLPRKVALFSHSTIKPLSVAAGEVHTSVMRSDGSMVTVGRVTHGRFAEGACIGGNISRMRTSIDIQNPEDWHHFPC